MKKNRLLFSAILIVGITFTNCSKDEDSISPTISIQSPDLNETFKINTLTGIPEGVILKAQGVDETDMESMKVTVTNSSGIVVFEESEFNGINEKEILITSTFRTENSGVYNAVFQATDGEGNTTLTQPRVFTYED